MTNRRTVLTQLAAGAAAVPAVALGSAAAQGPHAHADDSARECARPGNGPYADYFPNVVVETHEGRRALFYNDLLRGKIVLVNCMSIGGDVLNPVTANLVRVQRLLGERAGRDVFMYSITLDPERDTPRALAAFAERHGVKPGWLFLTGKPDAIDALRGRLFAGGAGHGRAHGRAPQEDCSLGLIRYGNEAVGLWGAVPARTDPGQIVERFSWVSPRAPSAGPPRRRGPAVSAATGASPRSGHRS